MTSRPAFDLISEVEASSGKLLFTPGPPPALREGLMAIEGAFGRGDPKFESQRYEVLSWLAKMTGMSQVLDFQGSGSLAIEIMLRNFVFGKVLVVQTGYYSQRLELIAQMIRHEANTPIQQISLVGYDDIHELEENFDWILATQVETSRGTLQDIRLLRAVAEKCGARLAVDAVASVGLEDGFELADCIAFSSCKGLLGITGAGFVAYRETPQVEVNSFYMSLDTHVERRMTGPYNQMQYLHGIMSRHAELVATVSRNKGAAIQRFQKVLTNETNREPKICTAINVKVETKDARVILYSPRLAGKGSILSHLGEVHLRSEATGQILNFLEVVGEE